MHPACLRCLITTSLDALFMAKRRYYCALIGAVHAIRSGASIPVLRTKKGKKKRLRRTQWFHCFDVRIQSIDVVGGLREKYYKNTS